MSSERFGLFAAVVPNCILNILFSLTTVALNSVTIHAIRKTSATRLPRTLRIFLLSLALSDLGVGLIAQPFIVVLHFDWLLEKPYQTTAKYVDAFGIMAGLSIYASMLNVMALTTDRFLGVHLHLRYEEIVTVKRVAVAVAIIWVLSGVLSIAGLWITSLVSYQVYNAALIAPCLLTTALLHCKILAVVRRHGNAIWAQQEIVQNRNSTFTNVQRHKPSIRSTFYVYLVSLLCYLPVACLGALGIKYDTENIGLLILQLYSVTFWFASSCLNPLIFCWNLRQIRRTVLGMLGSIFSRQSTTRGPEVGNY